MLVSGQANILDRSNMSTLPPILYKPIEEGERFLINDEEPWLSAESIVAHFEPLIFGDEETISNGYKNADNSRIPRSSLEKREIGSTSSLEKCSSDDTPLKYKVLIGSKIKVWWPLDKVYYEGVVKSYDQVEKKYEILYDDGDTEYLNLDEEKWKPVRDINKTTKRRKLQHLSSISPNTEIEKKKSNLSLQKRKSQRKAPRQSALKKQKNCKNTVKNEKEIDSQEDSDVSSAN